MWEVILLVLVVWAILLFFYKQALTEFTIRQLEWTQRGEILGLLRERAPLVIRGLPPASFWTTEDLEARAEWYADVPVFDGVDVASWVQEAKGTRAVCPWKDAQAEEIGRATGIRVWEQKWVRPFVIGRLEGLWTSTVEHSWAGRVGMRKLYAVWTLIMPMEGAITVSILPSSVESVLPASWAGGFPAEWTARDTPFLSDVKYVDVVVRPGTGLLVPAHWFVSWSGVDTTLPMVCTISYHTPISRMAHAV